MIPLYDRVRSRITGLSVDIFKPTPADGEWYLIALELNVKFIFQCTMHKTIVGGNQAKSALKQSKSSVHWCKGCSVEAERYANCSAFLDPDSGYKSKNQRGLRSPKYQNEFAFKDNGLLKDRQGNLIKPQEPPRMKPSK